VGQTLDSRLQQLRAAGCSSRNIYREKVTGTRADRRELLRMLERIAPGDVVTVTGIDRLARSTFDLFGIVKRIVDAKAQFRSLAEPWVDTGTSTGRLMNAVLGGLAGVERDLIRTRTAEGPSRAQKRGQRMGRPSKLTDAQRFEAQRRRAQQFLNSRAATMPVRARFTDSQRERRTMPSDGVNWIARAKANYSDLVKWSSLRARAEEHADNCTKCARSQL
jgi:DNA invertase Pin-like site-specific DNA recombinase